MLGGMRGGRGLTPVVSSIIMCAVVLVIGASVWGVASSASSIMQSDYYDEVIESIGKIEERFFVESIGLDNTSQPTLKIWVFNYGEVDITVEWIRVQGGGNVSIQQLNTPVSAGEMVKFDLPQSEVKFRSGLSVTVEVKSVRGNKAYETVRIP